MAAEQHPTGHAKGLEYLSPWDDGFEAYLDFMDVGIRLAARNKEIIAQEIMAFLGVDEKDGAIKTNHNYYDRGERTVRKGAVSAKKTVGSSLDEAPDAYKSFDFIREHIAPTAEVADRLVPLYNLKG